MLNPNEVLTEAKIQFQKRIDLAPSFSFPAVDNVSPPNITKSITECAKALEYRSDLLAEIPTLRFQVNEVMRFSNKEDINEIQVADINDFLNNQGISLAEQVSKLKTQLSTLRSLLSAMMKSPNIMTFQED